MGNTILGYTLPWWNWDLEKCLRSNNSIVTLTPREFDFFQQKTALRNKRGGIEIEIEEKWHANICTNSNIHKTTTDEAGTSYPEMKITVEILGNPEIPKGYVSQICE